ncbi:MAG: hypothetical protein SCH71_01775 [Desulfobulbaceae bacterium]|nr:hypothetical protein [Desulfobulbaceae bacterium]
MKKLSLFLAGLLLLALIQPPGISAVEPGDKLVSFTGKTMAGKKINIDRVIGNKPVLLFFWATW